MKTYIYLIIVPIPLINNKTKPIPNAIPIITIANGKRSLKTGELHSDVEAKSVVALGNVASEYINF